MPVATRLLNTGTLMVNGEFDEFTGAPVVDSSLQLWLDAGQTTSYSGSGTTWTDLSGNGRTGTLTGGPTYSTTNGGSIVFDGINDYVQCTGSLTVTAATFVAWIRRNGTQNPYSGIIFSRGAGSNISGLGIGQTGTTNQIGYTWHGQSSSYFFTSNLTIPNLTWCMIAVSVTSTAATLYLCQSSGITTATNTTSHPSTVLDDIKIAQDEIVGDRWFKGNIASAQIYNKALTAAEITQNYNAMRKRFELSAVTATQMPVVQRQQSSGTLLVNGEFDEFTGAPVVDSSLKLWLDAGQTTSYSGSGATWTDLSGNGNNGTLVNSPTFISNDGGGCIQLDGSNDHITLPVTGFAPASLTIDYWIKRISDNGYFWLIDNSDNPELRMLFTSSGKLQVYFYDDGGYFSTSLSTTTFSTGSWYNITVTLTNGSQNVYINGNQEIITTTGVYTGGPSGNAGEHTLGTYNRPGAGYGGYANVRIGSYRFYNRVLTAAEITQNYNALQSRYGLASITSTQMPVVQRQQSSGTLLVNGEFEEYTVPISQTFTTSASFVVPAGVTSISAVAVGGGGGGGGGTDGSNGGGGGGGGALAYVNSIAVTPAETLTIVVGASGTGGAGLNVGTSGGLSSIARSATILLQANGGTRGNCFAINANNNGGAGGTVATGSGGAGGAGGLGGVFGGAGGGGAGGYSGTGGAGGSSTGAAVAGTNGTGGGGGGGHGANNRGGGGGGVGINGVGSNGTAGLSDAAPGLGGSDGSSGTAGNTLSGTGGLYGGGGAGGADSTTGTGGNGATGAIKIFYRSAGDSPPQFPAPFV